MGKQNAPKIGWELEADACRTQPSALRHRVESTWALLSLAARGQVVENTSGIKKVMNYGSFGRANAMEQYVLQRAAQTSSDNQPVSQIK